MSRIPKNHPRYVSLIMREKVSQAMKDGLVHKTGLISHGRGEAFDYLLGEKTISYANNSAKVAAAALLFAKMIGLLSISWGVIIGVLIVSIIIALIIENKR